MNLSDICQTDSTLTCNCVIGWFFVVVANLKTYELILFIIIYLNITKTLHLNSSKYLLGKFHNRTLLLNNAPIILVKNEPQDFLQKNVVSTVPNFLLHQMLFLISRINRLYARDYYFYRCTLRSQTIFSNWKTFKNDEKCFLFYFRGTFRSPDI